MSSSILTLSNGITVIRLILVPFFVAAVFAGQYAAALLFFSVAAVSDGFDGWLARKRNERTEFGAFLDPFADKVLLITTIVVLSVYGWVPMWWMVTLIGRDLVMVVGYVLLSRFIGRKNIRVTWIGKTAIAFEMGVIVYILVWLAIPAFPAPSLWMFLLVAALSVGSGLHYIYRGFTYANKRLHTC
jgi:cardiolipin synthase